MGPVIGVALMLPSHFGRIPRFTVSGEPHERGRQYGEQAADLIARAVEIYRDWFSWYAGVSWTDALAGAERMAGHMRRHCPGLLAEMRGIAAGSGQPEAAVVAINARTEIAYGLGLAQRFGDRHDGASEGCTSWAILPEHTVGLGILCGQNWDFLAARMELRVALHIRFADGFEVLTFCEAGQVGKIGFNSAGLVVCLNLLATLADGDAGVPVHALCRLALEQRHLSGPVRVISAVPRAASSNLLIGRGCPGGSGEALDIEYSPVSCEVLAPEAGLLVHTNHFLVPPGATTDQALLRDGSKSTFVRQMRGAGLAREAIWQTASSTGGGVSALDMQRIQADHFDHPYSICAHVSGLPGEVGQTNLAFMAAPSRAEFWLSDGPPCGEGRGGPAFVRYEMPWAGSSGWPRPAKDGDG